MLEGVVKLVGLGTGVTVAVTGSLNSFDLENPSASFKVFERINMNVFSKTILSALSVTCQCPSEETLPGVGSP